MGFTLRFALGLTLVVLTCQEVTTYSRPQRQIVEETSLLNSTKYNESLKKGSDKIKPDFVEFSKKPVPSDVKSVKVGEPKLKTDQEIKNVDKLLDRENKIYIDKSDDTKNLTSIKLETSVPVKIPPDGYSKNDVKKDTFSNVIKQDRSVVKNLNREDSARFMDIDIDKYVSPEFHNKNNVYTFPSSPETEKYVVPDFDENLKTGYADMKQLTPASDLTTPKTDYFDRKYKEAVDSVDQKLEHIGFSNSEESQEEEGIDKLIEDTRDPTKNAKLDYVKFKNIDNKDVNDRHVIHKDMVIEVGSNVNFQSRYNDTKVYEEPEPKTHPSQTDSVEIMGHEDAIEAKINNANSIPGATEVTTQKNYIILTTRKSIITKAPVVENNNHILSNKIETETIKAINNKTNGEITNAPTSDDIRTTSPKAIDVSKRGSVKFADYATNPVTEASNRKLRIKSGINDTTDKNMINKTNEQSVQENQILPVHVLAPEEANQFHLVATSISPSTTSYGERTTKPINNLILTTSEPDTTTNFDRESTTETNVPTGSISNESTLESEITEMYSDTSSVDISTTTATEILLMSTETLPAEDTTLTENVLTTSNSSVALEKATTGSFDIFVSDTTHSDISAPTTTTIVPALTTQITTEKQTNDEKTSVVPHTTESYIRTSKEMAFERVTIHDNETTTPVFTTEIRTETTLSASTVTEKSTVTELVNTSSFTVSPKEISPSMETANTRGYELESTIHGVTDHYINNAEKVTDYPEHTITTIISDAEKIDYKYTTIDVKDIENRNIPENITTDEISTPAPTENYLTSNSDDDGNVGKIAAIVSSTVGGICLVLVIGLLYIMRKRQKRNNNRQLCTPVSLDDYSMDNSVVNAQRRKGQRTTKYSYGNPAFDDPVAPTHPLNFPALAKFSTNYEDMKAEFEEIPQVTAWTTDLPEGCETKNRYANVIPLPDTRVFLTPIDNIPNSDYINANYVTGNNDTRKYYIATQAPLQNTVDDFWKMIWEQQSKLILMLTHLFENGVEKCIDYLPPSEVLDCHRTFGDFRVTLKKREVKDKYIISSLQLTNMVSNSWREVTHFYYLGWPEKGVPSEVNSLITFLIEARSYMKTVTLDKRAVSNGTANDGAASTDLCPVVVHCSPGTGRTGVVIACDIGIREFEKTRMVDIPRIVYRIRRERASSVQTKEQYQFIYKVVSVYASKLTGGALDSF